MDKARNTNIDSGQWPPEAAQTPGCGALSLLWNRPVGALSATLVLAHGAGAPMDSPFMDAIAEKLSARGVAVARFEFPYMAARRADDRKRPPNPQKQLLECWREVYAQVRAEVAGPLAIGGKSMGGRMASLLADELGADALVCLGYPFYAAGKDDKPRVAHLAELATPTLIVQGERDALGDRAHVVEYVLSPAIQVHWLTAADHDLKPLKASGLTHEQHLESTAEVVSAFLDELQIAPAQP
ncbi:alpha/beta family hydrolase [Pseudomonas sp. QL9]|uniref:Putative hydrolase n=1 Tax=Pseudomonas knackmussii (strain DSM 6978 / CCUG 54928 / LMG 23759 / B13) TaxID=1301098 RepID=A0A024HFW1_PSEKB|nr:putative hydrolase [Pseudomonas knackmussii B13]